MVDSLTVQIIVTVLAGLAYVVGLTGIIVPVLPGTITLVLATLVWAIGVGGWPAWTAFGLVLVFGAIGMGTSYVLTGDRKSTRLNSSHGSISYAVFCLHNKISPIQVTPALSGRLREL